MERTIETRARSAARLPVFYGAALWSQPSQHDVLGEVGVFPTSLPALSRAGIILIRLDSAESTRELFMTRIAVETEQEVDGRWISEVPALPGVLAYGETREEAIAKAEALALRALAERLDNGEEVPELFGLFAVTP